MENPKINSFIADNEPITVANGEQTRFNEKISVNKFGDGFISWNEAVGFSYRSIVILIKDYQLYF